MSRRETEFPNEPQTVGDLMAASPSPPAGGGEPVAWHGRSEDGRAWEEVKNPDYFRRCGWQVRPLYTSPDAAQQRIAALEEDAAEARAELAKVEGLHRHDRQMWDATRRRAEAAKARALAAEAELAKAVEAIELAQDQLNTYRGAAVEEVVDKFEYVLSAIRARHAPGGGKPNA